MWPSSFSGKFAERRPSISTTVDDTPRPRSDTAAPPAEKPLRKPVEIDPALSAETERIASCAVVMLARNSVCEVRTVTGEIELAFESRNSVPVTTTVPACPASGATGAFLIWTFWSAGVSGVALWSVASVAGAVVAVSCA